MNAALKELVEEVQAAVGANVSDESSDPVLRRWLEEINGKPSKGTAGMPLVHGFIVHDPGVIGALAGQKGDQAAVFVYEHTFVLLYSIFIFALRCRDILPTIGNAAVEVDDVTALPMFGLDREYRRILGPPDTRKPVDAERRQAALQLAGTAIGFIMWHEWAHIRHGHLRLVNQAVPLLFESVPVAQWVLPVSDVDYNLLRRTIEWDADGRALERIFWGAFPPGAYTVPDEQLRNFMRGVLFAVLTMIAVWDRFAEPPGGPLETRTHPTPALRYGSVIIGLQAHMLSYPPDWWQPALAPLLREVVAEVVPQVERLVSSLFGPAIEGDKRRWLDQAFGAESAREVASYNKMWSEVHDTLLPLAYGTLPPKSPNEIRGDTLEKYGRGGGDPPDPTSQS